MNGGKSLCLGGSHHNILRCPDTGEIKEDIVADELTGGTDDPVAGFLHPGTQRFQPQKVKIDLALPDGTATGLIHPNLAESGQKRPHQEDGRSHLSHQLLGNMGGMHQRRIDGDRAVCQFRLASK
ncbi:hypothetical protein D3C75_1175770 [compost metagenome]